MHDSDGYAAANLIGGFFGGVSGATLGILLAKNFGLTGWRKIGLIAAATAGGAVLGAFLGPYAAKLLKSVGSLIKTGVNTAVKQVIRSSGRTSPQNLAEQIFMRSVKSSPLNGAKEWNELKY